MPEADGRVGVCRQSAFFRRLLGTDGVPETEAQWLEIESGMLAAFRPDAVYVDGEQLDDVIVAVSPTPLGGDVFDSII